MWVCKSQLSTVGPVLAASATGDRCYEHFMTGWVADEAGKEVSGKPVGLTQRSDDLSLIVDDAASKISHVTYHVQK